MAQAVAPAPTDRATPDGPVPAVSVVAPAYNEAKNLTPLVREAVEALEGTAWTPFEIVLVDDGSDDDTAETIRHLAELYDTVRGVELAANFGQSAALAAGLDAAHGHRVVTIDADGQNDPADIPRLLRELEQGADCVSGWRKDRNDPLTKTIPSKIQTWLSMRLAAPIHDYGCTLTAYRREAVDALDLRGERHRYIPADLHARGFAVTELEVNHRERQHGSSHYGAGRLVRGFVDLLYHGFASRYRARPMHFFGAIGLVLFVAGMGLGTALLVENYLLGGALLPNLAKLILATTLTLAGAGVGMFGVLVELLMELRYRDATAYRVDEIVE